MRPEFTSKILYNVEPRPLHISPKTYGEYLLYSGKWKKNRLRNKIRNKNKKH